MVWRIAVLAWVVISLFLPGRGVTAGPDSEALQAFLERIQKASDQVTSFSADFIQEKRLVLFDGPVFFEGKLYVDRPDRLRWEFTAPVPSVLMLNGDEGVRCDEQMAGVGFNLATDPVMGMVASQLWLWLGGDYQRLERLYGLAKQGNSTLLIMPADQATSDYISTVSISFNEDNLQPEVVKIVEPGGNVTVIRFTNPELNATLSPTLFTDCGNE